MGADRVIVLDLIETSSPVTPEQHATPGIHVHSRPFTFHFTLRVALSDYVKQTGVHFLEL